MASPRVVCIEDFRPMARSRVPKPVFDYLDGGAEGEVTLRENCRVFNDVTFRPRHAVAVAGCGRDLRTRVLGFDLALPFLLAPVGYSRLMHPGGEVAAARAAGRAGTGYILSTISGHKLEDVKAGSTGPVFYQLYLMGGRGAAEAAIERARVAGFSGLVVTIDTPVAGIRERDHRNGLKELDQRWTAGEDSVSSADSIASGLADQLSAGRRFAGTSECGRAGQGADGAGGYQCGAGGIDGDLGGFAVDSGDLARADCGEGCADG